MKNFITVTLSFNGEIENLHVNINNICYYWFSDPNTIIKLSCGEELIIEESISDITKAITENQLTK